jgi:hypothetical protein
VSLMTESRQKSHICLMQKYIGLHEYIRCTQLYGSDVKPVADVVSHSCYIGLAQISCMPCWESLVFIHMLCYLLFDTWEIVRVRHPSWILLMS